ncbi:helix-turn-helix transcriptional regulator [Rickettsiales bacterium]|nr:helix-turn-helix transcriptional regulator [Rickettsiales bacterium]
MSKVIITSEQCKAARDLLKWNQGDLSKNAGINKTTLADFERGVRNLKIDTLEKIINAFEKSGIRFENDEIKYRVDLLKKFEDK